MCIYKKKANSRKDIFKTKINNIDGITIKVLLL